MTLRDEFGFAYTVEDTPCCQENRRDSRGRLGPKPLSERRLTYDEKQIRPREPVTDINGRTLEE